MDWLIDGLRTISGTIDFGLLYLANLVYDVFQKIADVDLLANGQLSDFTTRIYVLLGVFMLIKLTISLFKYLIDPDTFSDNSKGFGKLIQNVIVSLLLIISVPFIYDTAMRIQKIVLDQNVIGNFILGVSNTTVDPAAGAGETVTFSIFNSFFTLRSDLAGTTNCNKEMYSLVNEEYRNKDCWRNLPDPKPVDGTVTVNCDCYNDLKTFADEEADLKAYSQAYSKGNFEGIKNMIYGLDVSGGKGYPLNAKFAKNADTNYTYLFSYSWGVSWLAAVFLIYIFATFCVDIGIRVVKLAFLVIIAPIPILSKIDPSGKGEMFSKWLKMCGYTYLDVFIRYASVFFIVYVIKQLPAIMATLFTSGGGVIATLFIIFGALLFAKELPNLLQELIPGMKDFGGGFGKSFKKLGEAPILGRGVKSLSAGTAAGFAAYRANRWDRRNENKINAAAAELDAKQRARAQGKGAVSSWMEGKKAKMGEGAKGTLDNLNVKNMAKDARGVGREAANARDEAWSSTGWLGGENKSTLAKAKAAKTKATNEQLTKMRDGYKAQQKAQKVYDQIVGTAKEAVKTEAIKNYDATKSADQPEFKNLNSSEQNKIIEQAYKDNKDVITAQADINEQKMYVNKEFGKKVTALREAKEVKNNAQSVYETAKMSVESGSKVVNGVTYNTSEEAAGAVDKLRIASVKASTNYDFLNTELKEEAAKSPNDADTYTKYEKAKDSIEKREYMAEKYSDLKKSRETTSQNKTNTTPETASQNKANATPESTIPQSQSKHDVDVEVIDMEASKQRTETGSGNLVDNLSFNKDGQTKPQNMRPNIDIKEQVKEVQNKLETEIKKPGEVNTNPENKPNNKE